MLFNLIKKLNQPTKNIIGAILDILIISTIASLAICLVFSVIGKFAKLSFMTSWAGVCFLISLITGGVLITIASILLILYIIDKIKRGELKKLFKKYIKTFAIVFIIVMVICFIKYNNLEWISIFRYSLLITLFQVIKTEAAAFRKEIEQED